MKKIIDVFGMTCMHCHKRVTDSISKVHGVSSVEVNLENNSATIDFDEKVTDIDAIKQAVTDAGYEVSKGPAPIAEAQGNAQSCPVVIDDVTDKKIEINQEPGTTTDITLKISGMTCAACAANIEKVTKKLDGVVSSSVNVSVEKASITYDPTLANQKDIENAIVG